MGWIEQESQSRRDVIVTADKAELLDRVKAEAHPVIAKEAAAGDKHFEPLRFQPIRSPGHFEAEFARKDDDLVFHFWPWGFHSADRENRPRPAFIPGFGEALRETMVDTLGGRFLIVEEDRDMGAWFVRASGYGKKQFWREIAIRAVTRLHRDLGGE